MFANVMKGAPLGNKNAAGPRKGHDFSKTPTDQLNKVLGAFAPHANSSDDNREVAAAMVKELAKRKPVRKSDYTLPGDLGLVKKGAPLGNKNAAGKRGSPQLGYSPKAQAAASATAKAKESGSSEDHQAAFEAHRTASSAANRHGDKKNATLHSQQAQSHFRNVKKTESHWLG